MIVHLNVPDAVILERISGKFVQDLSDNAEVDTPARWVHLPSGRVYNTTYSAPKVPGRDDVTGEALVQRPDDTPVSQLRWYWCRKAEQWSRKRSRRDYKHTISPQHHC